MKTKLILLTAFAFCMITCKKEENSIKEENKPIIQVEKLLVGLDTNVIVTSLDTILIGGYGDPRSIDLDIDGDTIPDFRFTSEIWGSAGLGQHPKSTILSLNSNSLICGILKSDSSILHRETSTIVEPNNSIHIYNYYDYTCRTISKDDSILSIVTGQFKLLYKSEGDTLNKMDLFKTDTAVLADEEYSYPVFPTTHNDTTIYDYTSFDYTCDMFPSDQISYIGIMIKSLKGDKLGWIKLKISDKFRIYLIESSIQKYYLQPTNKTLTLPAFSVGQSPHSDQ